MELPIYQTEEDALLVCPDGWTVSKAEDAFEKLPTGRIWERKELLCDGTVPVLDQSLADTLGFHRDEAGVSASPESPVVTFANHTCAMRLVIRPFSVIQNVFPLVGRPAKTDTRFLLYWLNRRVHIEEYKGHFPDLRRLWFPLPPLAEQRAIAGVLGALDDKIESNRRTREIVDQYLLAEYLGRHRPDWVSVRLGDCADLLPGKFLDKAHYGESGTYPVLGSNSEMGWTETPLYDGELICLARIGSNFGAVRLCLNGAWINNNASAIRAKSGFDLLSVFYFLKTFDFGSIRRGSGQPFLAHNDVENLELRLPLVKDRDNLMELGRVLSRRAELAQQESRVLRNVRDALLPELLSGRLRVSDAEKAVEGAL